ncbi:hypothetical protein [Pseudomonas allokribbensis]|uniref:hypothetical protein n=1 Tax=Pseudomonas allokribbensis TaxID=2774460 RepID=UPI001ABC801C|nr:hypothetical protein [Pseudomonas allokribbensis]
MLTDVLPVIGLMGFFGKSIDTRLAVGSVLTAKDFICLFDAFHQLIKKFAHRNLHCSIAVF